MKTTKPTYVAYAGDIRLSGFLKTKSAAISIVNERARLLQNMEWSLQERSTGYDGKPYELILRHRLHAVADLVLRVLEVATED